MILMAVVCDGFVFWVICFWSYACGFLYNCDILLFLRICLANPSIAVLSTVTMVWAPTRPRPQREHKIYKILFYCRLRVAAVDIGRTDCCLLNCQH